MEAIMKKCLGFCALILLVTAAWATPANTAILDGRPIEYDSTDLRGTFQGASSWGADGTLTNLFVTWDATYLYVALQGWHAGNKLVVLLDVDPGSGTGATTTTNWFNTGQDFFDFNDYGWIDGGGFGLDYLFASQGTFNNVFRLGYNGTESPTTNNTERLFDSGNGSTPSGSPVDMACLNNAAACTHKGFEARIPWTNLYTGTRFGTVQAGEIVPRGAALRILAGLHNDKKNDIASSPDTIPNQTAVDHTNGILTASDYLAVVVDSDTNGIPDLIAGDNNAPWIRAASGAVGGTNLLVAFSEAVTAASAQNAANWTVGGTAPSSATALSPNLVRLGLAVPIASTNLLPIVATGVQDAAPNTRSVEHCLYPAPSGIPLPVTVTFQVNTNSGMGISSTHTRPAAFFVNGAALPLEWGYSGYPPHESTQMTAIPGSNGWVSATVTFLAGTPSELFYKYSARIAGSNNYEAIRLTDFSSAARKIALNTNGTPMVVVDYLGAAAHPLRNPGDTNAPSAQNQLYVDAQRGDAGIRARREILFQLDLSLRNRDNLQRVMVLGSDPLRGFNSTGEDNPSASDYPGSAYLAWDQGGIQLVDDGTLGDLTADDGIYSRSWGFSTNGIDAALEAGDPYSLVGGTAGSLLPYVPGTMPYEGYGWTDRRSPRSFIYKFYVLTDGNNHFESPASNIEHYISDPEETAPLVLNPFLWDNDSLPPPPPSNAPALTGVSLTGTTSYVRFENVVAEGSHGVKISTNLISGFDDYGHRASAGSTNGGLRQWSASIAEVSPVKEYYSAYAGLEPTPTPTYWIPNGLIPTGATTVRVYFCQYQTNLKGMRSMHLTGSFRNPTWDNGQPMAFLSNGIWMTDIILPAAADGSGVKFKPRGGPAFDWLGGGDFQFVRGTGGVSYSPQPSVPGSPFTITLNPVGTPLATASNVYLHMGFDNWKNRQDPRPAMTNVAGSWEYTFPLSTNYSLSVDWVFTTLPSADNGTWYSDGNWHAFMAPYYVP
jgi:hypothetical protein